MRVRVQGKKYLIVCALIIVGQYVWLGSLLKQKRIPIQSEYKEYAIKWNENVSNLIQSTEGKEGKKTIFHQRLEDVKPIVTMFTTIRDRECRKTIHSRLIKNWAALSPHLDPVLFVPFTEYNNSWISTARSNNWKVRILYALRHNLPVLTAMFKEILASTTTPFIGYANADILFDTSLITTLRYLSRRINVTNEMILIVGRRRNVDIDKVHLGSGDNLTKISQMDNIRLFIKRAQDYFIISRRGLPWNKIPDFVVGRNGYDNWLVTKAQDWNITLIDTSNTVLALHQSGIDGFQSGWRTVPDETRNLNKMLVEGFNYSRGSIALAPFYTKGQCDEERKTSNSRYCNQIHNITLRHRPFIIRRYGRRRKKTNKLKTISLSHKH